MVKTYIVGRIDPKKTHKLGAILSEHLTKTAAVKSARTKSNGSGSIGLWRRESQRKLYLDQTY